MLENNDFCWKVLLKTSSNASLVDSSRRTALHWAVHHGHIACVKLVLLNTQGSGLYWEFRMILNKSKLGLDWQAGDQGGVTVLHLAQRHNSKKMFQVEN